MATPSPSINFRPTPLGGDLERDTDQTSHQPQPSQNQGVNPTDYWKNLLAVRPDNIKINFNPTEVSTTSNQPSTDRVSDQNFRINGLTELLPVFEADPWEKLQKLIDQNEQTQVGDTLKVFGINQDSPKEEKKSDKPEVIKQRGWKEITKDYINFKLFFKEVILKTPKSIWKFFDFRNTVYKDLFKTQMIAWGSWKKSAPKKEGDKKAKVYPGFFRNLGGRGTEVLRKLGLQRKSINQRVGFSNDSYQGTVDDNFQVREDISIMLDHPASDQTAAELAAKRSADIQRSRGKKGINQKGQFEGSTAGGSAHTSAITAGG